VRISALCFYLGLSERTVQRWRKEGLRDGRKNSKKKVARKLSAEEEQKVYEARNVSIKLSLFSKKIYATVSLSGFKTSAA
jgi:hypothetical protein